MMITANPSGTPQIPAEIGLIPNQMWSAIGDPVLLPSPYDSAWMLNRASEVEPVPALRRE